MTNLGAVAILTVARSSLQHCAGPGCPLPYIGRCSSAVPSRDCTPRALPRASRSGRHVGLRPPRNDKSGSRCGRRGYPETCNCPWRAGNAAADAIGAYLFNVSLYRSPALCRARLSAIPAINMERAVTRSLGHGLTRWKPDEARSRRWLIRRYFRGIADCLSETGRTPSPYENDTISAAENCEQTMKIAKIVFTYSPLFVEMTGYQLTSRASSTTGL